MSINVVQITAAHLIVSVAQAHPNLYNLLVRYAQRMVALDSCEYGEDCSQKGEEVASMKEEFIDDYTINNNLRVLDPYLLIHAGFSRSYLSPL